MCTYIHHSHISIIFPPPTKGRRLSFLLVISSRCTAGVGAICFMHPSKYHTLATSVENIFHWGRQTSPYHVWHGKGNSDPSCHHDFGERFPCDKNVTSEDWSERYENKQYACIPPLFVTLHYNMPVVSNCNWLYTIGLQYDYLVSIVSSTIGIPILFA